MRREDLPQDGAEARVALEGARRRRERRRRADREAGVRRRRVEVGEEVRGGRGERVGEDFLERGMGGQLMDRMMRGLIGSSG